LFYALPQVHLTAQQLQYTESFIQKILVMEDRDGYSIAHFIAYLLVAIVFFIITFILHLFLHNWIAAFIIAGYVMFGVITFGKLIA